MPYANNNGVRIYYEIEGNGPPLVLAHPITASLNSWKRDKFPDALRNDFQLILFDARGHGQSDKPREASAYAVTIMANDVLTLLDTIGIRTAHYFGYSMGAKIGFWLATHHTDRFNSFILGGTTPYSYPEIGIKAMDNMITGLKLQIADPEAHLQRLQSRLGRTLTEQEKKARLSNNPEGILSIITSFLNWPPLTDEELAEISLPCLVFCGELDEGGFHAGAKESVDHIPQARFISFPGLNHFQAGSRSDLILPHIKEFLEQVSKI